MTGTTVTLYIGPSPVTFASLQLGDGNWHHGVCARACVVNARTDRILMPGTAPVSITWTSVEGHAILFVDGMYAAMAAGFQKGVSLSNYGPLTIGFMQQPGGALVPGTGFVGSLQELRIWSIPMHGVFIRCNMQRTLDVLRFPDILAAYWPYVAALCALLRRSRHCRHRRSGGVPLLCRRPRPIDRADSWHAIDTLHSGAAGIVQIPAQYDGFFGVQQPPGGTGLDERQLGARSGTF